MSHDKLCSFVIYNTDIGLDWKQQMLARLRRNILDSLAPVCEGKVVTVGKSSPKSYNDLQDLVNEHFGNAFPQCRKTLTRSLQELNNHSAVIVETGSSAWGVNSSMLFDAYVNSYGGSFHTVDKRLVPLVTLRGRVSKSTTLYCDDSIRFLGNISKSTERIDLVYLDSWDVDWYSPMPAAYHGLCELLKVLPNLRRAHGLLLVDDTPADSEIFHVETGIDPKVFDLCVSKYGVLPGKGGLILNYLQGSNIGTVIQHDYQLLVKF
jgi:hypothetical protein